jgi:hypothetical protein
MGVKVMGNESKRLRGAGGKHCDAVGEALAVQCKVALDP